MAVFDTAMQNSDLCAAAILDARIKSGHDEHAGVTAHFSPPLRGGGRGG